MDNLQVLLTDPVVLFSAGGLLLLFGIGAFYIYLFISKMNNNE